jgi:hypothetical protein
MVTTTFIVVAMVFTMFVIVIVMVAMVFDLCNGYHVLHNVCYAMSLNVITMVANVVAMIFTLVAIAFTFTMVTMIFRRKFNVELSGLGISYCTPNFIYWTFYIVV